MQSRRSWAARPGPGRSSPSRSGNRRSSSIRFALAYASFRRASLPARSWYCSGSRRRRGASWPLREALTDPAALPQSVVDWLRLRSVRLSPNLADLIERLVAEAPKHPDAGRLLEACRIPQATARWRLRKRGLPAPSRWFQAARALHAALRLQARPEASTMEIARQIGFADHSALIHLFRRSFGMGATEIRCTLGWEWLLDRWFHSHAGGNASRRRRPAPLSARV